VDYQEALDDALSSWYTRKQAIAEIKRHNLEPTEFFSEIGERKEYLGSEILGWIGY
jgi:hypothetical protein